MRVFFAFALALLCALLLAAPVQAKYWVNTFSGSPSGYVIERGGKVLVPVALMGLEGGDRINVKAAGGQISIFEEGSKSVVLTPKNAPFSVPASKPPGILDNLVAKFTTWTTAKESANVTLSTRGTRPQKSAFLAVHADKNLLPVPVKELFVAWQRSDRPLDLSLTRNGKTIARLTKTAAENLKLSGLALTPGDRSGLGNLHSGYKWISGL